MNRHLKVTIQRALLRYLNKAQPFWAHTSLESQLHSLPCGLYLGEWTLERNYSHSIIEVFKQSPATLSPYLPRTSAPLSPLWVLPWRMDTWRYLFTQHYWGIQQSSGTFSLQLLRKSVPLSPCGFLPHRREIIRKYKLFTFDNWRYFNKAPPHLPTVRALKFFMSSALTSRVFAAKPLLTRTNSASCAGWNSSNYFIMSKSYFVN